MFYKKKNFKFIVVSFVVFLSGCQVSEGLKVFNGFDMKKSETYIDTTDSENISRVRFIGNITGTSIKQEGEEAYRYIVPHTWRGFYNDTKDIGMPKVSNRKADYEDYYFEIKVKAVPTTFFIGTDQTYRGRCMQEIGVNLASGKDYDINFVTDTKKGICIINVNEVIKDESTGAYTLKPVEFEKVKPSYIK